MNIGIDIDGVITDFSSFEINRGKKMFGDIANEKAYHVYDMFNVPMYKELLFWLKNIDYLTIPPKDGTKDLVKEMILNNDKIFFITVRNCFIREYTKNWLKNNGIYYDYIYFTRFKKHIIKKYNIDLMIEDSPSNIENISKYIPVIALSAPYNQHINNDNVYFANDLYEIKNIYKILRRDY